MAAPDWGLLLTATLASLVVVMTPGPNNIILASIGATRGVRQAMPYAFGVVVGFPIMLGCIGFGLGNFIRLYPQAQVILMLIGGGFLAYLAWRIVFAPVRDIAADVRAHKAVPGFIQSVLFQWLNPKGLSYAFGLIAAYARPSALVTDTLMLMLMACLLSALSAFSWVFVGALISRCLGTPNRQRWFNGVMGFLLLCVASEIMWRAIVK